jgi:hypothetical protein
MGRMAGGDDSAAFMLCLEFRRELAAAVRRAADHLGARLDPDDIDGLVVDVSLALRRRAPGWDPDRGALPWTWARPLVVSVVSRHVGQYADALDDVGLGALVATAHESTAWEGDDPDAVEVLSSLAGDDEECRLLEEALAAVASTRTTEVLLRYAEQQHQGDPSPAHTVGDELAMQPPAVRQVVCRLRRRLLALASDEPRYAPIAGLALVG